MLTWPTTPGFIDRFLADDVRYLEEVSSAYDYKPNVPVRLYHGRDDRTVPLRQLGQHRCARCTTVARATWSA